MDDFPAGPASPGSRGPALSVVVPVRDGGGHLGRCLRGLRDSTYTDFELIVVDDGSADDSAALAAAAGARVIRHGSPLGPAAARNAGAEAATAPIVFFLDADVVVHPDALARAVARLAADPTLAGLFGSYDDAPAAPGVVSRFRNLLHHYVHHQGDFVADARPVRTFWTGCGAIRRRAFLDLGGFDPRRYRRPAIEDIELGYRLNRAGHRIVLARDVLAKHLKRWTLAKVVRTDIFQRGVPWTLLMLRSRVAESDLNVSRGQKLCVALTGLAILAILGSASRRRAWPRSSPSTATSTGSWPAGEDGPSRRPRCRSTCSTTSAAACRSCWRWRSGTSRTADAGHGTRPRSGIRRDRRPLPATPAAARAPPAALAIASPPADRPRRMR